MSQPFTIMVRPREASRPSTPSGPPVEDPCRGHPCDGCAVCRSGRCCRRDDPAYQLPALGEWEGPVFGSLGVLCDDGERAQCHACGRYYHHLGNHVRLKHNLTPDEYRALFGLNASTGLVGPALAAKFRALAVRLEPYHEMGAEIIRGFTSEQLAAYQRGRPKRLEGRIKPENREKRRRALAKGLARQVELRAAGWVGHRPSPEQARAWGYKVQAHLRERRAADPAFDAAWRRAISDGRGGKATLTCAICGAPFQVQPSRAHKRKLCGKACRAELRRRHLAAVRARPDVQAKAAATRRANPAHSERMRAFNAARAVAKGARTDGTIDVSCAVCGTVFATKLRTTPGQQRKTCGEPCLRELQRHNGRSGVLARRSGRHPAAAA